MPPLLCPSPDVIDQTFPRSIDELRLLRKTLAEITDLIQLEKCRLILTDPIRDFIVGLESNFDWTQMGTYPELQVIYYLLGQLGLQQHGVQVVDVTYITEYSPHPLPSDCVACNAGADWSDELGRLLVVHSTRSTAGKFFIGVACTLAFAGKPLGKYDNPGNLPAFPLVGPQDVSDLDDSVVWVLPDDLHRRDITFNDAYSRIKLLGGAVETPRSGSSHYPVRFKGARTWPLDKNLAVIPDDFLRELVPITGYSLGVIKFVLLFGEWPDRASRI